MRSVTKRTLNLIFCLFVLSSAVVTLADDWPQWRGPQRDGVWREEGVVERFASEQIPIKWRMPIGAGYSGPSVADGRVFITDRVTRPTQLERIWCFDEQTGKTLWKVEYPCEYEISYTAGPRATVTVDGDRAYALGAMGHLHCLHAKSGEILWKRDLNSDFQIRMPIWGIAAAPLIVDDVIVLQIGGTGACIVGLNKTTGADVWKALDDRACYSAPILIEQAGKRVAVCWTGDSVAGIAPENGNVYWRRAFRSSKMPIGIATPIVEDDRLFVTSFYDGSLMLKFNPEKTAAEKLWYRVGPSEMRTDALQSIISTPIFFKGHLYGVDSYGELRCLDPENGDRLWEDRTATPRRRWSNIHFVRHGDDIWMFNELGELIISHLSPQGFEEISRAKLISPTTEQLRRGDGVCWAHPAFANRHVFARNDREIVCANLAAE